MSGPGFNQELVTWFDSQPSPEFQFCFQPRPKLGYPEPLLTLDTVHNIKYCLKELHMPVSVNPPLNADGQSIASSKVNQQKSN